MTRKALFIGAVWPESNSSAAGQNMAGLLTLFRHNGIHLTFATAAADSVHADDMHALSDQIERVAINDASFDRMVSNLKPDIVVFDRYMTEEQFSWRVRQCCPHALHVLNTEDLHHLRFARHQAVKMTGSASDANLNNSLAHREIAAILRSDISLITSSHEYDLLVKSYQIPLQQLILLPVQPPIGDTDLSLGHQYRGHSTRMHFVTVGNFKHAPNWDSILQLHQHIWPAIRQKLPDAKLHIYGAYPPKKATELNNPRTGFLVKGWAEDVHSVMAQSRVCLAPLRFGAGVKGKLLTAITHNTPSVTTQIGAEGITSDVWPGRVADTSEDFIRAAVELYTNSTLWQLASDRCPGLLTRYLQTVKQGNNLLFSRITDAINDIQAFRSPLFYQSMLWHHSLRSTQFMSQWIEAKNQVQFSSD